MGKELPEVVVGFNGKKCKGTLCGGLEIFNVLIEM